MKSPISLDVNYFFGVIVLCMAWSTCDSLVACLMKLVESWYPKVEIRFGPRRSIRHAARYSGSLAIVPGEPEKNKIALSFLSLTNESEPRSRPRELLTLHRNAF
jgi:hypothetical protein